MNKDKISPTISIDSFTLDLLHDRIVAYVAVEGQEEAVVFDINQIDFEKFCDDNELRNWNNDTYTGWSGWTEDNGTYDWDDIYSSSLDLPFAFLDGLLKQYVQHIYNMEEMDFQPALNKILNAVKSFV